MAERDDSLSSRANSHIPYSQDLTASMSRCCLTQSHAGLPPLLPWPETELGTPRPAPPRPSPAQQMAPLPTQLLKPKPTGPPYCPQTATRTHLTRRAKRQGVEGAHAAAPRVRRSRAGGWFPSGRDWILTRGRRRMLLGAGSDLCPDLGAGFEGTLS